MNSLKVTIVLLSLIFSSNHLNAQSINDLLGKWETTYIEEGEKATVVYEFIKEENQIKAYTILIKDDKGNKEPYKEVALDKIKFKDGKGKGTYFIEYDGDNYDLETDLKLKDATNLELSYSYWGYSDTEIWKKIE